MFHFDEKPYFGRVVDEGGFFFFGSTHKPRTEGSRDVEARVRACAEKQNGEAVEWKRPLGAV